MKVVAYVVHISLLGLRPSSIWEHELLKNLYAIAPLARKIVTARVMLLGQGGGILMASLFLALELLPIKLCCPKYFFKRSSI